MIPNGTQQTLGNVCNPRKSGPSNWSISRQRHITAPSTAPKITLIANPTSNRSPLTMFA